MITFIQENFRHYIGNVYGSAYLAAFSYDGITHAGVYEKGDNLQSNRNGFDSFEYQRAKEKNIFRPLTEEQIDNLRNEAEEKGYSEIVTSIGITKAWRGQVYL